MKVCVLYGSSSKTGYTYSVLKDLFRDMEFDLINLSDQKIDYLSFEGGGADDFITCIDQALKADLIVLTTPVYWFNVSAQIKLFFDRLVDLLYFDKPRYEAMKERKFAYVATYESNPGYAFEATRDTLKYLKFELIAHISIKKDGENLEEKAAFIEKCLSLRTTIGQNAREDLPEPDGPRQPNSTQTYNGAGYEKVVSKTSNKGARSISSKTPADPKFDAPVKKASSE